MTMDPLNQLIDKYSNGVATGGTKGYTEAEIKALLANGTMSPEDAVAYLTTTLKVDPSAAAGKVALWQQSAKPGPVAGPENPLGGNTAAALKAGIKAGTVTTQQAIGARVAAGKTEQEAAIELGLNPNTDYGNVAPRDLSATGGSPSAPTSGGGGGTSGGGAPAAVKAPTNGSTFSVAMANGVTNQVREMRNADGTSFYVNLNTGERYNNLPTAAPPQRKLSVFEQAAQSFTNGRQAAGGGGSPTAKIGRAHV